MTKNLKILFRVCKREFKSLSFTLSTLIFLTCSIDVHAYHLINASLLHNFTGFKNDIVVKGKVIDTETGLPLPGTSIKIKGTDKGTKANADGSFSLQAPEDGILIISYLGYETVEIPISKRINLNIQLHSTGKILDVVTIGYGSVKKNSSTGSLTTVTSKDFQRGSITTPEQLLSGKVAGVSITPNGGQPGAGATIRIRGGASLNASNDPLLVIDGVPLSNNGITGAPSPLSTINPNDIESFTILKDAAATAIYGSRASNGVILITTKKGASGQPKINFNSQITTYEVNKYVDVLNGDQVRELVNQMGNANQISLLGQQNTDWQNAIYQRAVGNDNNLSVSGTYKSLPYRVSAGYLNQQGVLITDQFKRASGSLKLNPNFFNNHLKVDLTVNGSISKTRFANTSAIWNAISFDPTQVIYTPNAFGNYFEWMNGALPNTYSANRNPVALLNFKDDRSKTQRSFGNIQLDYKFHFLPDLHANLNLGYDNSQGAGNTVVPAEAASDFAIEGYSSQYKKRVNNTVAEFYLNYIKDIPSIKSNINATAGYGYYNFYDKSFSYPFVAGNPLASTTPVFPTWESEATLLSYYGRLIYSFANKYVLAASLRTDGSSKFAQENRWGVFPSVALTWKAKEENFLKNSSSLSDLKFRLSYGITGQQDGINYYGYIPVYVITAADVSYQFGNSFYPFYSPTKYDTSLKWEQTSTYNAGVDYGFLNNRITGSVDVYFKKTKDLLNNTIIPPGVNFGNRLFTNVGNVENKGVEFNVSAIAVKSEDVNWTLGFNLTYNQNKITKLSLVDDPSYVGDRTGGISNPGGPGTNIQVNSIGHNLRTFYVYKQIYDQNGKPIEGVYDDLNGDGVVNEKDLYRFKSADPKLFMGFSTQFDYKKWSLSTVLRANLGNYMYNNTKSYFGYANAVIARPDHIRNANTDIYNSGFLNPQLESDYYIENASFLRMDNLGLSYNAGKIFGKGDKKVGLRLSANCQNVFVITKYSGFEPEINGGIDNSVYPRPRTFVLGVNLDF